MKLFQSNCERQRREGGTTITVDISKISGQGSGIFADGGLMTDITGPTTLKIRGVANSDTRNNLKLTARFTRHDAMLAEQKFSVRTWPSVVSEPAL
jgi:hypothetical protein